MTDRLKEIQALRKRLENKGILNLPELVDVEDYISELITMIDERDKQLEKVRKVSADKEAHVESLQAKLSIIANEIVTLEEFEWLVETEWLKNTNAIIRGDEVTNADLKLYGKGEPKMYEDLEKDHLRLEARLDRDCRIKELEAQLDAILRELKLDTLEKEDV